MAAPQQPTPQQQQQHHVMGSAAAAVTGQKAMQLPRQGAPVVIGQIGEYMYICGCCFEMARPNN